MSWKKHFRVANNNTSGALSPIHGARGSLVNPGFTNYGSLLPEVYAGHPNRVERYSQYETMDLDSEVNAALDILAEFCTQPNEDNTFFDLDFKEDPTETETKILTKELQTWCSLNKFDSRVFKLFRNTLKYGDQLFVRDPETFELMWVDMNQVIKIIVNESKGKEPEQYVIHDINVNFENLTVTQIAADTIYHPNTTGGGGGSATGVAGYNSQTQGGGAGGRFTMGARDMAIDAENVVHLSLTEGLDLNWPFGRSILEQIFKVYKQKELLEDAIIIYRVQRAPERRVFKIDTGGMPSHMAMAFVERIKNEIWQRRIPTQAGGAGSFMDSTYNPLSINEDYFFPVGLEGRGSSVETLPGGTNLGEIDDLKFFTNKLFRGLRIPSSYLPTGPDESSAIHQDGKVGTALIQEFRFNQYCKRLQSLVIPVLDKEFKAYLKYRGVNIDSSLFDLKFNDPQNFASYRQAELDSTKINTFTSLEQFKYFSRRFLMERFLGLSQAEILQNEEQWREENVEPAGESGEGSGGGLRSVGISPGGLDTDLEGIEGAEDEMAAGEGGMEGGDIGGMGAEPAAAPAGGGGTAAGIMGSMNAPGP
jgi:Bacteriophage T4-like portal protein (Gp20)